jgi:hypothetical protein
MRYFGGNIRGRRESESEGVGSTSFWPIYISSLFPICRHQKQTMYIKTAHGTYIAASDGAIIGSHPDLDQASNFRAQRSGTAGEFTFQSCSEDKYLSCSPEGALEWNRDEAGPWERFTIELTPKGFSIKSCHGTYLCADANGTVTCDRSSVGPWECFEGKLPVTFKNEDGKFITATKKGLGFSRTEVGPWEVFKCTIEDGKATFKSCHGQYLCANGDGLVCKDEVDFGAKFGLVEAEDGCGFGLLTADGKCLSISMLFVRKVEEADEDQPEDDPEPTPDETEPVEEPTDIPAEAEVEVISPGEEKITYGFTDKDAKYEDVPWADLPPLARRAAESIGFDESTWDGKEWLPIDDKHWWDLNEDELKACEDLGWTKDSWNTKYEGVYWKSLPEVVKRACERMGWNQVNWDEDWDIECWDKYWDEFDDEEKRALHVLGYYVHTW